jgi:hypothetical protein
MPAIGQYEIPAPAIEPGPEDRYLRDPVPVCQSPEDLRRYLVGKLGPRAVCLFFGNRSPNTWRASTSAVAMNAVLGDTCVYLPVNVTDERQMGGRL